MFSKIEFLNIFNSFCYKTFKDFIIWFVLKNTDFIFYSLLYVIDKVCKKLPLIFSIVLFLIN